MRTTSGPDPVVRRRTAVDAAGTLVVVVGLVTVYALLPLQGPFDTRSAIGLVAGIAAVALLLAWQVRTIVRSATPVLRALEAAAVSLTAFLLLFASADQVLADGDARAFTEPLSRLDALYFVVTVFATVGFGDIAPVSAAARVIAMVQMIGDLVLIGIGARALLTAVERGRRRPGGAARPPE
ncbi:potassium channel family protein [Amnibacterium kyonggiense]|uniref:Ion channel n=1 Tax=Amnibacterium kyonggiense TaxID=595671 RepID=A0A4R7FP71_9MICO|nr:potassium channel family protein [Amnibacterium kyonggiense]TDS79535.1 ion channel [Amnibacterium kyonggiense]